MKKKIRFITNSKRLKMLFISYCDAPNLIQLGLQDPGSPIAEAIMDFHNHLFSFMLGIAFFVFYLLTRCIYLFNERRHLVASSLLHNSVLEIIWTIIPAFILIFIALPSFALLYAADEVIDPILTYKVVGHQWYWSYEIHNFVHSFLNYKKGQPTGYGFDSYMLPPEELEEGFLRNLDVDNRLLVPIKNNIRFLVTSTDVIHSWAIPSLGIKADATPGRLLSVPTYINRASIYYGQCSEICGINHAFMPIVIAAVPVLNYTYHSCVLIGWMSEFDEWLMFL